MSNADLISDLILYGVVPLSSLLPCPVLQRVSLVCVKGNYDFVKVSCEIKESVIDA